MDGGEVTQAQQEKPVMAQYNAHSRFAPLGQGRLIWIAGESFSDGDELLLEYPDCSYDAVRVVRASPDGLTLDLNGHSIELRPWTEKGGWLADLKSPYGLGPEWKGPSSKWTIK